MRGGREDRGRGERYERRVEEGTGEERGTLWEGRELKERKNRSGMWRMV